MIILELKKITHALKWFFETQKYYSSFAVIIWNSEEILTDWGEFLGTQKKYSRSDVISLELKNIIHALHLFFGIQEKYSRDEVILWNSEKNLTRVGEV